MKITDEMINKILKLASDKARARSFALGLPVCISKDDGIYLEHEDGRLELIKSGDYKKIKAPFKNGVIIHESSDE